MLWNMIHSKLVEHKNSILTDGISIITYSELLDKVEKLGNILKINLSSEDMCAILCKSEINTAISLLALFYTGITAVPLSLKYGELHCCKILDSIKPNNIITDENFDILYKYKLNIYNTDNQEIKLVKENIPNPDLHNVAAIMCTSGTTGIPKGAMITYNNLQSNIYDILNYFEIHTNDKIFITRPLYHTAVMTGEFLVSLMNGLSIYFYNEQFNPIKIIKEINQNNITVLCGTPTLFYHICNMVKRLNLSLPLLSVAVSGECMTTIVAELMEETFPNVKIYNVYGLTEASPRVAYLSPELFKKHPLSVGVPLKSIKVKIVDDYGKKVNTCTMGELVVKGPNIMKGYYNDSQSTNRILKDGWLHTGDIAYIDENGFLYIKSRKDNMINRAGMNIYPQEIENALKLDDCICDVLAFGVRDDNIDDKIYLKIVPSSNKITKAKIFDICKKRLPLYQIPDNVEFVEVLQKNGSGKIVRPKIEVKI